MLVEHLDVVARVFLRGERVELAADRIDRLRDVFGGAGVGALEEHVLDEVRDAAALGRFVPRAARQPHADADRAHLRHRLGERRSPLSRTSRTTMRVDEAYRLAAERLPRRAATMPQSVEREWDDENAQSYGTAGRPPCADKSTGIFPSPLKRGGSCHARPLPRPRRAGLPGLELALAELGQPRFHARQIFRWIYRRGVTDFAAMTDLRATCARARGADSASTTPGVVRRERSTDGTTKFLLELADGTRIESVFIPDTPAHDLLHLDAGRLRDGVRLLPDRQDGARPQPDRRRDRRPGARARRASSACSTRRFNIVLMGMGEPLHNYDETMKALRMLADEHGLAMSPRRDDAVDRRRRCRRSSGSRPSR